MYKYQKTMLDNYIYSKYTDSIFSAYSAPSWDKQKAWHHCRETQFIMGGYAGKVCTKNTFRFTYAFLFRDEAGTEKLCYITPGDKHIFAI